MNSAKTLLWIVEVLSNFKPKLDSPLHNPPGYVWIMQYPLQREAGDDGDLVCLEVMTQLPRGHKEAEEQFLHTGVP